jgi:hypothetical protein
MDFTRDNSNSVVRARKLAWKGTDKAKADPYNAFDLITFKRHERDFLLARNMDFSFKHEWQGKGKWNE